MRPILIIMMMLTMKLGVSAASLYDGDSLFSNSSSTIGNNFNPNNINVNRYDLRTGFVSRGNLQRNPFGYSGTLYDFGLMRFENITVDSYGNIRSLRY